METNTQHSVKAYLHENPLTDSSKDYVARVSSENSLNVVDICKSAVARGGATISAEAIQHGAEVFFKEMGYLLGDGYSVNTGFFSARAHIKGVFNSPKEPFSPDKHAVLFQFNQGELLRKTLPNIKVEILGVAETGCEIMQVIDVKTGSVNDLITPNRNIKIKGNKIKVAGDNELVGIYFIHQTTGVSTAVHVSDVVTNNPSEVIVVVPELAKGVYALEIRTQYSGSNLTKEPRIGIFDKQLIVS